MSNKSNFEDVFRGYWWLPSNPDVQWYGKLRWRPKKSPRLKLRYKSRDPSAPPNGAETLLGLDSSGTPLTLLRVDSNGGTRSGFLSQKRYNAGHILKGIHLDSLGRIRLNRVNLWLQFLGDWLSEEGFASGEEATGTTRIEYQRPEDREYQISSNLKLKVCHSARSLSKARERKVGYDIFFAFESRRKVDFKRTVQWINALRNLLHFTRLRPIFATAISFENFDYRFQLGEETYPKEFELFNGSIASQPDKVANFQDFVFTFNDIEDRFSDVCAQWLRFCVEQRESLGCYTATIYQNLTDELRLVSLTQALEAFHERRYRPTPKTEAAHFVNRIKDLCGRLDERMIKLVGDVDRFAESVRDSRHYYTHHDPSVKQKGNVLAGSKLTMMTYHLQYLYRLCVLMEFNLAADPYSMPRRQIPDRVVEYYD